MARSPREVAAARDRTAPCRAPAPREPLPGPNRSASPESSPARALEIARARRHERVAARATEDAKRATDRLLELEGVLAQYEALAAEPIEPVSFPPLRKGKRPAVAVALLSDVHYEERVTPSTAVPNTYTPEIAGRRLGRFFRGVDWMIRNARAFEIDTVVCWLGGDIISGDIHEELLEVGAMPPREALLDVQAHVAAGLAMLTRTPGVRRVLVPCSYGNHGRTTDRMRAATGFGHSLEWIMYQNLAAHFVGSESIQIHADKSEHQAVTVGDYRLAFHHGHRIRYQGGIGGITVPLVKKVFAWDQWERADYWHFGHFHSFIDLGRIMVNGSLIGPSAYSRAIGASPEPARQGFYILDAKRGKTSVSPIWVTE